MPKSIVRMRRSCLLLRPAAVLGEDEGDGEEDHH